jgi:hypothetical protein
LPNPVLKTKEKRLGSYLPHLSLVTNCGIIESALSADVLNYFAQTFTTSKLALRLFSLLRERERERERDQN